MKQAAAFDAPSFRKSGDHHAIGQDSYPNRSRYMPHIVLGDPSQRAAVIKPDDTKDEHYVGVWIADSPDELLPEKLSK
jgi:hypothetical protein